MYELVDTPARLSKAIHALQGADRLYLDTEFESTKQGSTLCLLQVSRGQCVYLIDALGLTDLTALVPVFGAPEWVVHAGRQDVELVLSRLELEKRPTVFDTQVAWALLGAESAVSLAYLAYRVLGVRSSKALQTDDWVRRPLKGPQLEYAAADVEHLPALHAYLEKEAVARRREALVRHATSDQLWPEAEPPDRLTLASFRHAWQLGPESQSALRALVGWYGAQDPSTRVNGPEPRVLMAIAARLPTTASELERIRGIPKRWCAKHAERIIALTTEAVETAGQREFVVLTPPPYATFFDYRLGAWLEVMRADVCEKLQASPDLLLPKRLLHRIGQALVTRTPLASVVTGWRAALVEDTLQQFIERHPPPTPSEPRTSVR